MAKKLDRTRPYGEIFGMAAAAYEQDGRYFNRSGEEITQQDITRMSGENSDTPEPPPPPPPQPPVAVKAVSAPATPPAPPSPSALAEPTAPEAVLSEKRPDESPPTTQTDDELRVAMATFGEPFTTRAAALEFLRDKT